VSAAGDQTYVTYEIVSTVSQTDTDVDTTSSVATTIVTTVEIDESQV